MSVSDTTENANFDDPRVPLQRAVKKGATALGIFTIISLAVWGGAQGVAGLWGVLVGAALGGGLELALHTHYRVIADVKGAVVDGTGAVVARRADTAAPRRQHRADPRPRRPARSHGRLFLLSVASRGPLRGRRFTSTAGVSEQDRLAISQPESGLHGIIQKPMPEIVEPDLSDQGREFDGRVGRRHA